ncbi:MAG: hypothetical protein AB7T49_18350 [Oligoflexales bacterium]
MNRWQITKTSAIALFALISACATPGSSDKASNLSSAGDFWVMSSQLRKDLPLIECDGAENFSLGLSAIENVPSASALPFPQWNTSRTVDNTNDFNVRLDVCFDQVAGKADLRRIVYRLTDNVYLVMTVKSDAQVSGLEDAVFGDVSHLKVVNRYTKGFLYDVDQRIVIQGMDLGGEEVVALINEKREGENYIRYVGDQDNNRMWTDDVMVGQMEVKDPFSEYQCAQAEKRVFLDFDDTRLELQFCEVSSTSGGWAGEYTDMVVIDSDPSAPSEIKGIRRNITDLKERGVHHNICDGLILKTELATYYLTAGEAGAAAGPDLDQCLDDSEGYLINKRHKGAMAYKKVYHFPKGDKEVSGFVSLLHYAKNNPNHMPPE